MGKLTGLEIVHPLMLGELDEFYPSECTIQQATEMNTKGEVSKVWADLAGHVDIPCQVGRAGGQESKRADQTITTATHTLALAGHYPTITTKMRAKVGTDYFDLLAVRCDGDEQTTWLDAEIVT